MIVTPEKVFSGALLQVVERKEKKITCEKKKQKRKKNRSLKIERKNARENNNYNYNNKKTLLYVK